MSRMPFADGERAIKCACQRHDIRAATTLVFELYGSELLAFLSACLPDRDRADEVFAVFVEDLWNGIARFDWRCSIRGWAYALARNAAARHCDAPAPAHERAVSRSRPTTPTRFGERMCRSTITPTRSAQSVRRATTSSLEPAVKQRMRALRNRLPQEDQTLLILHVDRGFQWTELALIMHDAMAWDADTLERHALRLRKRFRRIKAQLKRLAIADGLL